MMTDQPLTATATMSQQISDYDKQTVSHTDFTGSVVDDIDSYAGHICRPAIRPIIA
jgi:hypothetical protein